MSTRMVRWYRLDPPSLPIRDWLPHYRRRWLRGDVIAAVAVWAVLVPEGMAYASLAGMPPQAGLFAALAPLLAYAVLGTCRQLTIGPSSAVAAYSAAAVADSSGVKSQLSNVILFGFLIMTMLFLLPFFHDLPEAVLGAIVIAAVSHLVDVKGLRRLRRIDKTDYVIALLCFVGVLVFGLLVGLAIAVGLSLLALVYRAYRPSYAVLGRAPGAVDDERLRYRGVEDHPDAETFPGLVILRVDGELFFANAHWFRDVVRSLVRGQTPPVRELLVHAGAVPHIDTTAADMLRSLIKELDEAGVSLAFARATTGLVHDLQRNGITRLVDEDLFYDTVAAGVDAYRHGSPQSLG